MKNKKFKVGNLVEHNPSNWKHLGIVIETGIDFPPFSGLAKGEHDRRKFINIRWTNGKTHRIYKGLGNHYEKLKVVGR